MAASIGQHTPVFLPGEPPDREAWQATVHRVAELDMTKLTPTCIDAIIFFFFFACGSSVPVRAEREDGAAWVMVTVVAPSVLGHGLPQPLERWPYLSVLS